MNKLLIVFSAFVSFSAFAQTPVTAPEPVTPLLCQQVALEATGNANAKVSDELRALGLQDPYAERVVLELHRRTGYFIDFNSIHYSPTTTVQEVAEELYDATTR